MTARRIYVSKAAPIIKEEITEYESTMAATIDEREVDEELEDASGHNSSDEMDEERTPTPTLEGSTHPIQIVG